MRRELDLKAIQRRVYKQTAVTDARAQVFSDKLNLNFPPRPRSPGKAWIQDITYFRTKEG